MSLMSSLKRAVRFEIGQYDHQSDDFYIVRFSA